MMLNKNTECRFTDSMIRIKQNDDMIVYLKYADFQKLINCVNSMS